MITIKNILGVFLVLVSLTAFATSYGAAGNITGMFAGKGNIAGVFHAATWHNPAGCPNGASDKAYLIDYSSQDDWSKVHSMLLSAYISQKPVKIAPHLTNCYAGYPVINRVAFVKGY